MSSQLIFSVKDALVRYKETPVFEDLTLNIHQGSRIALVGKNGAGKSTIMNIITGVKSLDEGERWENPGTTIGYLVQDFQPDEKETVFDFIFNNIKGEDRELYQYKVDIAAEALDLDVKKPMTMLSGGQLRRAGLAKAFVEEPDILLLDEPFAALDAFTREELWCVLRDLWIDHKFTTLLVTHDLREAAFLADKIFVMSARPGKITNVHNVNFKHKRDLKIKTLKKFLDKNYQIEASVGHIRDLPSSKLGIDLDNNFTVVEGSTYAFTLNSPSMLFTFFFLI